MTRLIAPLMEERSARMRKDPNYKKPSDMIQWIMDNAEGKDGEDTKFVAQTQMLISLVAIHTTTMTVRCQSSVIDVPLTWSDRWLKQCLTWYLIRSTSSRCGTS